MKNIVFVLLFGLTCNCAMGQKVISYKTKTKANEKDRTMMLDILRAKLYEGFKQEFIFEVNKFNLSGNFAWVAATAQRKDGKSILLPEDEAHDCCHVESLFKKSAGKWYIVESAAFATDVWWEGIWERTAAPRVIFK